MRVCTNYVNEDQTQALYIAVQDSENVGGLDISAVVASPSTYPSELVSANSACISTSTIAKHSVQSSAPGSSEEITVSMKPLYASLNSANYGSLALAAGYPGYSGGNVVVSVEGTYSSYMTIVFPAPTGFDACTAVGQVNFSFYTADNEFCVTIPNLAGWSAYLGAYKR
jgi:hypothetical protein